MNDKEKSTSKRNRIYFLDNLRTFIIFLVVLYHAGGVYEPSGFWATFWIADDPSTNELAFQHKLPATIMQSAYAECNLRVFRTQLIQVLPCLIIVYCVSISSTVANAFGPQNSSNRKSSIFVTFRLSRCALANCSSAVSRSPCCHSTTA